MTREARPTIRSKVGDVYCRHVRRLAVLVGLSAAIIFAAGEAEAVNGTCEELKLELPPIYEALQSRLRQHMFTRDNDLKITVEQDLAAYLKMSQIADRYDKRVVNAIRDFNDDDPEAEYLCRKYILQANCEAYLVYQDAVANLPGIKREAILAEGKRRCDAPEQLPRPQTVRQDENAAVKQAYAATLDRLAFTTNRQNLFPISDAEALVPIEQQALGMNPGQQISWTGPSGKSSGTISVIKAIPVGPNYEPCKEFAVTITTAYSTRDEVETFCAVNGQWRKQ